MYLPFTIPNLEATGLLAFAVGMTVVCVIAAYDWHFMRFHPWVDGWMLSIFPGSGPLGRKRIFRYTLILIASALFTLSIFCLLFALGVFQGPGQYQPGDEMYLQ